MLSPDRPDGPPGANPSQLVLDTLERLQRLICELQDEVLVLVAEAHSRGATWSEIARRLGRSKQCVHERYQRRMHADATRQVLRRDLAEAWRRARMIQLRGGEDEEVAMLVEFLRERAALTDMVGGEWVRR